MSAKTAGSSPESRPLDMPDPATTAYVAAFALDPGRIQAPVLARESVSQHAVAGCWQDRPGTIVTTLDTRNLKGGRQEARWARSNSDATPRSERQHATMRYSCRPHPRCCADPASTVTEGRRQVPVRRNHGIGIVSFPYRAVVRSWVVCVVACVSILHILKTWQPTGIRSRASCFYVD